MPTTQLRFALLLVDSQNPYQLLLQADAEAAARRANADLVVNFCGHDTNQQIHVFYQQLRMDPTARPQGIIIIPHRDAVLARTARDAAQLNVGLAVLNRIPESLEAVRREFPKALVLSFTPDQRDIGRIQGQQFVKLLPKGGRLAYVRGDTTTMSSKERQAGMEEVVRGKSIEVAVVEGGWVKEQAQKNITSWLRTQAKIAVDLIGCQNDDMALGARAAVDFLAGELNRPDLKTVPITGCDGLPAGGQKYVTTGQITATIVNPSTSGAAVTALAQFYTQSVKPAPKTVLQAQSFPDLSLLKPIR